MNMVAHTTDPNGCAFCVVDNLAYIGVHTLYVFIKNTWACGLDMEYDVQVNFAKRLCHNTFLGYSSYIPYCPLKPTII